MRNSTYAFDVTPPPPLYAPVRFWGDPPPPSMRTYVMDAPYTCQ